MRLWPFFEGSYSIWQNCEPTLANVHCCIGPNIERINSPSGHTGGSCAEADWSTSFRIPVVVKIGIFHRYQTYLERECALGLL